VSAAAISASITSQVAAFGRSTAQLARSTEQDDLSNDRARVREECPMPDATEALFDEGFAERERQLVAADKYRPALAEAIREQYELSDGVYEPT